MDWQCGVTLIVTTCDAVQCAVYTAGTVPCVRCSWHTTLCTAVGKQTTDVRYGATTGSVDMTSVRE